MQMLSCYRWLWLVSGSYALACIPAILVVERLGWNQRPLHLTQWIAVVICAIAGSVFLWGTRSSPFDRLRWLAIVAVVLGSFWLAFVAFVWISFDLRAID
jgi:cytochrome b subunit of formate dehydrogenase